MKIGFIHLAISNYQKALEKNKKEKEQETKTSSPLCSKETAEALKNSQVLQKSKIPESGEVPKAILIKCQSGEKGAIIDKETGKPVPVSAKIEKGNHDYRILKVFSDGKEIGHASFTMADKEHPALMGTEQYMGEDGALYVDYMQNNNQEKYSHVGTLMHRIMHEISKQEGCKGKMVLDSTTKPLKFHYGSGFRPAVSFNADNDFWRANAKVQELDIVKGHFGGSCIMCLAEENMEDLEKGKHCTPDSIKNMTEEEYDEQREELKSIMKKSSPWD